ncbi:hypothetical protein CHUAL_012038 [Chamberlinius hualienensis]
MSFRPGDSKREEFRKYLEKAGLLDALTRALVNLYNENEKPTDALQYMKDLLFPSPFENQAVAKEIDELKKEIAALKIENEELKSKLNGSDSQSAESEVSPQSNHE